MSGVSGPKDSKDDALEEGPEKAAPADCWKLPGKFSLRRCACKPIDQQRPMQAPTIRIRSSGMGCLTRERRYQRLCVSFPARAAARRGPRVGVPAKMRRASAQIIRVQEATGVLFLAQRCAPPQQRSTAEGPRTSVPATRAVNSSLSLIGPKRKRSSHSSWQLVEAASRIDGYAITGKCGCLCPFISLE
ncbi:hypothetical protein BC834DRAFT_528219 [Gloeopeniophorella convolvens]|nr:hypothetical protein BC834DRAFT_528219 [Gloeopeniophorella convolvens]